LVKVFVILCREVNNFVIVYCFHTQAHIGAFAYNTEAIVGATLIVGKTGRREIGKCFPT